MLGVVMVYVGLAVAAGPIEARYGFALAMTALSKTEWIFLGLVVLAGTLVGVLPAWKAYRSSLADGLSVKV